MTDELRQCNYCPNMILWGTTVGNGRAVPLDPTPIKIYVHATDPGRHDPNEPRVRMVWGFVPHHATCSGVDQARADVEKKRAAELEKRRR